MNNNATNKYNHMKNLLRVKSTLKQSSIETLISIAQSQPNSVISLLH